MFGPTNSPIRRGALLGPMAAGLLLACSSTTTGPGQRDIVLTARLVDSAFRKLTALQSPVTPTNIRESSKSRVVRSLLKEGAA